MDKKDIVLYIGAGYDLSPLFGFDDVKLFIYIDIEYYRGYLEAEYIEIPEGPDGSTYRVPLDTMGALIQRKIREQLKKIGESHSDYEIIKETATKTSWILEFKNGKTLFYLFHSYPNLPDKLPEKLKTDLYDKATILYVDGFVPDIKTVETYKEFKNLSTIYWSVVTADTIGVEKVFPNKKIIYTQMRGCKPQK